MISLHFDLSKSNEFTYKGHTFTVMECVVPFDYHDPQNKYDIFIIAASLSDDPDDSEALQYYDMVPNTFQYGAFDIKDSGIDIYQKTLDDYIEEHKKEIV